MKSLVASLNCLFFGYELSYVAKREREILIFTAAVQYFGGNTLYLLSCQELGEKINTKYRSHEAIAAN